MQDVDKNVPSKMKAVFAIFMVLVYLGMGILVLMNFFAWSNEWTVARYCVGILFIVYGIFRGYRELKR